MQRARTLSLFGRPGRRVAVAVVAIVAMTTVAACHSGGGTAAAELPIKGGTLNVILSASPIVNLDPQEISLATDANFSRLLNRTLTTTNTAGVLVPDLATDTGRPNADNTVWEFTLKQGVKWQDGSPVTCQDVQYGVERRYAPAIDYYGGLSYPKDYLKDNNPPYQGPYVATDSTLDSIVCIDTRTVEFHLQRAVADFGYTVSVNTFAPVKKGSDSNREQSKKEAFNYAPFSNGPYKVDSTQTQLIKSEDELEDGISKLVLVRNPYWDPGTDSVRKAYPNVITMNYDDQRPQVTNNLINSTGNYQYSISLDGDVSPNFVQQVINDPVLSKRAISGDTGSVRYIAINTRRVTNVNCRIAMEYAFDKRTWRFVLGGSTFGALATSMIPPSLPAHEDFDLYETKTQQDGDVTKAAALWKQYKCPATLNIGFANTEPYPQLMGTVVTAYQRIGVLIKPVPLNHATYYENIGNPYEALDMTVAGWVPDWPNGSAVIPPLFSSGQVAAALSKNDNAIASNENYSMLQDPAIDNLISEAFAERDLTTQYHLWGEVDKALMTKAVVIPVIYSTALRMEGTKVRGAAISASFGEPDLATMGVAK